MTTSAVLTSITNCLTHIADESQAEPMSAYMRHQFQFLGIPTPERRAAIKSLNLATPSHDDLIEWINPLWLKPEREYVYTAIDLLKQHQQQLSLADLPWIQSLALQHPWWDSIDNLASLVGQLIKSSLAEPPNAQLIMDEWLTHPNLWIKRIAMIHQMGWRLSTDTERLAHYALTLAPETNFFIRKAIGWALRDYARWHPQWVMHFVETNHTSLSPLTRREAIKRIPNS